MILPKPDPTTITNIPAVANSSSLSRPQNPFPKRGGSIVETTKNVRVIDHIFVVNNILPEHIIT